MPKVAAFIDSLRKAFGDEHINDVLKRGVRGEPVFFAQENGFEIGTPLARMRGAVKWDAQGISYIEEYPAAIASADDNKV